MKTDSRIAVIGAGAAGLSAAWFLRKRGYRHVTVLERSPRIGGKCKSLTFDGRSFDLGANYITASYTQVRRLAARFGMSMFTEGPGHAFDQADDRLQSLLKATTQGNGLLKVGWASLRYLLLRFRLRRLLAPAAPGFLEASGHDELCGSFLDWLKRHDLEALQRVFDIPITLMGYDKLSRIPAAYPLTYMNPRTFINLMLFALDPPFRRWPKRFDLGYERLWERVAAEIDVLRGARITRIARGDRVMIDYELDATDLDGTRPESHVAEFDALILACPLHERLLEKFLELTDAERELFGDQVQVDPFVVATYATSCSTPVNAVTFMMPGPQMPNPEMGQPDVITRQFADVPLLSIYSRIDLSGRRTRDDVLRNNKRLLRTLGAENPDVEPYTYDEWAYFPHVSCEAMKNGYYRRLEAQQGVNKTYYAGGLLAFELVETITEYSRHLVARHFGAHH